MQQDDPKPVIQSHEEGNSAMILAFLLIALLNTGLGLLIGWIVWGDS